MEKPDFDIIIVGGGMIGLAMASALAGSGLKIALLESSSLPSNNTEIHLDTQQPEYDLRVSAISPGNQQFLSEINCWQLLSDNRIADYQKMQVWDGNGTGQISFDAAWLTLPKLGSIVENQQLRHSLFKSIWKHRDFHFFENSQIKSLQSFKTHAQLSFIATEVEANRPRETSQSKSRKLTAKLLIGADGAFSQVRQLAGIDLIEAPYQQTAFVANVRTELPHQDTAWQRFTQHGPVAFLPLPESHFCSVVWSLDQEQAEKVHTLCTDEFANKLAAAFEYRLGKVELISDFRGFPLVKRHATSYLNGRCALIGDAAHTIHPLAGQGVNLGFQDVACLSAQIKQQHSKGRDFGLLENLRPFERQRRAENSLMQEAMSGFKWMFANQTLPITLIRNWAMSALDQSNWLKQHVIQRAIGL